MRAACVLLSCLSVVACGADPAAIQSAAGAGASDTGGATGSGGEASAEGGASSSSSGGGGAGAAVSAPPNPEHGGIVEVLSGTIQTDTTTVSGTMTIAYFWDAPGASVGDCTFTTEGACAVTTCTGGVSATPTSVNAGVITVQGKTTMTLTPTASGDYDPAFAPAMLWDPGQSVSIAAAGATVGAFAHAELASSAVTITSPPPPAAGSSLLLDRSHDLVVTWSGGSSGYLTTMWKSDSTDPFATIRCTFSASAGTGTISKTALQALPAGSTGSVLAIGGRMVAVEVGVYTVDIGLDSIPTWGSENGKVAFATTN